MLCPFCSIFCLVESLPGYWLSNRNLESLVLVLEHLVAQVKHCDVELDAKHLVDVCKAVEELGVLALEMYWNNIALRLHALGDECLLPWQVPDYALFLA